MIANGYCLFVADVCLCSEVLQPGSSWSSSRSLTVTRNQKVVAETWATTKSQETRKTNWDKRDENATIDVRSDTQRQDQERTTRATQVAKISRSDD